MTGKDALNTTQQALYLLGNQYQGQDAERLLLAIGLQESGFMYRKQIDGPARGFWQFEKGGGVKGVLNHPSTKQLAREVTQYCGISVNEESVYSALAENDILAAAFARLLLWTDPQPLPTTEQEAWECYLRTWRPGKPRPEHWPENWKKSLEIIHI